jgi:hypothetical protein
MLTMTIANPYKAGLCVPAPKSPDGRHRAERGPVVNRNGRSQVHNLHYIEPHAPAMPRPRAGFNAHRCWKGAGRHGDNG